MNVADASLPLCAPLAVTTPRYFYSLSLLYAVWFLTLFFFFFRWLRAKKSLISTWILNPLAQLLPQRESFELRAAL
jgi:hypothetical protein